MRQDEDRMEHVESKITGSKVSELLKKNKVPLGGRVATYAASFRGRENKFLFESQVFLLIKSIVIEYDPEGFHFGDTWREISEKEALKDFFIDILLEISPELKDQLVDYHWHDLHRFLMAFVALNRRDLLTQEKFFSILCNEHSFELAQALSEFYVMDSSLPMSSRMGPLHPLDVTTFENLLKAGKNCHIIAKIITILSSNNALSKTTREIIFKHEFPFEIFSLLTFLNEAKLLTQSNVERLLSPENDIFLVKSGDFRKSYHWEGLSPHLLTQPLLDEIYLLLKRKNSASEIKKILAPLKEYLVNQRAIEVGVEKRIRIEKQKWNVHARLIGDPRHALTTFFKEVFSWGLGFQWLLSLLDHLNLPHFSIYLPTLRFSKPYPFGADRQIYAGRVEFSFTQYRVTPLNFLFVPINYIAGNIGKLLGLVCILPWALPASLVNKAIHAMSSAWHASRIRRNVKNCIDEDNQSRLIRDWLSSEITVSPKFILKNADFDTVCEGMQEHAVYRAESAQHDSRVFSDNFSRAITNKAGELKEKANKYAKKAKVQGILATIIAAIILTPLSLFVSIPLLLRSIKKHKAILDGIAEGENNIRFVSQGKSIYELGMEYLRSENVNFARAYTLLSRVSSEDKNYARAMFECGNIALANQYHEEARIFFEKAAEKGLSAVSSKLAKGEKVVVQNVFDEPAGVMEAISDQPAASLKIAAVPRSFASNSPGLFVIPSESQGIIAKDKSEYSPLLGS